MSRAADSFHLRKSLINLPQMSSSPGQKRCKNATEGKLWGRCWWWYFPGVN